MDSPPKTNSSSRLEWLGAVLITVAIVGLHIHFYLHAGGLWRDEINTLNLARSHSLVTMSHDSFPVLMPALVSVWDSAGLGGTDGGLRLLGLLCGMGLPAAFWAVAWASGRPPLFSLTLFGLNTLMICYGDSLRAYGLGSALVTLALAAMCGLLARPSWQRTGWLALAGILSVQALFQNAILFFGVCLGGFSVCARRKDGATALKILTAGVITASSLLPYYANFMAMPKAAVELRRGFSPFIAELNYEMATGFPFEQYQAVWKGLAVIVVGFAALSLIRKRGAEAGSDGGWQLFAGTTLLATVALFIGFLWYASVMSRPWYFMPLLALVAVCFDCGMGMPWKPGILRTTGLACVFGTALISAPLAYSDLHAHFTDIDLVVERLETRVAPGDYVIVTPWFTGITFNHYYGKRTDWDTLPPISDHTMHRYDLVLEQMERTNSLDPVLEKIKVTLQSGNHVWVVGTLPDWRTNDVEPQTLPPPPLPGTGWSDTAYNGSWAARTGDFLHRHSLELQADPPIGDGAPNMQENATLYTAQGWRD